MSQLKLVHHTGTVMSSELNHCISDHRSSIRVGGLIHPIQEGVDKGFLCSIDALSWTWMEFRTTVLGFTH